ncbi:hypothetical protein CHUAL_003262 [Chamberlinius hualienensis]
MLERQDKSNFNPDEDVNERFKLKYKKKTDFCYKYRIPIATVILIAALTLVVFFSLRKIIDATVLPIEYTCSFEAVERIPCTNNELSITADACKALGCCWDDASVTVNGLLAPFCFHTYPSQFDYVITSIDESNNTTFKLKPWKSDLKTFGKTSVNLKLQVERVTPKYARIVAYSTESDAIPSVWDNIPSRSISDDSLYSIKHSGINSRLVLTISRVIDGTDLVKFSGGPIVKTGNYTEFTFYVPSSNIYGLGEAHHKNLKHSMNYEQWELLSRSALNSSTNRHSYGVQPFYLCVENSGNVHGVLIGLRQPSIISLQPGNSVSIRSSEKSIEIHVFLGPTAKDVMEQYTEVIGRPALPPYWALGYHTCRSNGNTSIGIDVINKLRSKGIPHESDCGDGLMLRSLSVAESSSVYKDFSYVSQLLHDTGRKLTLFQAPTVNNGSSVDSSSYDAGVDANIFIKNGSNRYYVGIAAGKNVVYPDFHLSSTNSWLNEQFSILQSNFVLENIQMDGIFLVDNTPIDQSSKKINPCPSNVYIPPVSQLLMSYYFDNNDTICLTATEPDFDSTPHYVWHNTYGIDHMAAVISSAKNSSLLANSDERVMMASLSTFTGAGRLGGHWGGDTEASWGALNSTLIQTLEYGLYGIPFTGFSTCGYRGSVTDEDLCWKWMLMSALLPMALTYYGTNESPREPIFFSPAYQTMSQDVLKLRYSLLPYMYTLFYLASVNGEPVVRPLFYEFPKDNRTWNNDQQFMLGPNLLVSPSLNSRPQVLAYFPAGTWYEFQTQKSITSDDGVYYNLLSSQQFPNVHIRQGAILITQEPSNTTIDPMINSYSVWVALNPQLSNSTQSASGFLYIDNGLTSTSNIKVTLGANFTAIWWTVDLDNVTIDEVNANVSSVSVTGLREKPINSTLCVLQPILQCGIRYFYDDSVKNLIVDTSTLICDLKNNFQLVWEYET